MNKEDYEQKRRECWEEFCKDNGIDQEVNISIFDAFNQIFDRAYALGNQTERVTQEEIEKAAQEHADSLRVPYATPGALVPFFNGLAHDSYMQGVQDFLGKQEKDAEGEEMLTVKADLVKTLYQEAKEKENEAKRADGLLLAAQYHGFQMNMEILFGPKCLPDETPLSQNPSKNCDNENRISTDCDKPAEPTDKNPKESAKTFALDSECRLNIAAMAMQGILANKIALTYAIENFPTPEGGHNRYFAVAQCALAYSDALILEYWNRSNEVKSRL